jgi:hypothetical protein
MSAFFEGKTDIATAGAHSEIGSIQTSSALFNEGV